MRENSGSYRDIFLGGAPLLDVRAPVEFNKGAFPHAVNLPLMDDAERKQVGTCYTLHGQDAAISLGNRLVTGQIKEERIQAWADFARTHPDGYLYCFRGGLRSQIVQEWLKTEAGIDFPRVAGGYKAMRAFLIATIEAAVAQCNFALLGGLTGTGKTELLAQVDNAIDLEGRANHRGSSFGKRVTPQPTQIDFENMLAIDLLRGRERGIDSFVLEEESRMIGACSLPLSLQENMSRYPLIWLEDSLDNRVERILGDYVVDLCAEFVAMHGDEAGYAAYAQALRRSLLNIAKRLGDERYRRLAAIMDHGLAAQRRDGTVELHRGWIEGLLQEYYDPMYAYQREKGKARIEFAGDHRAVLEYLRGRLARFTRCSEPARASARSAV